MPESPGGNSKLADVLLDSTLESVDAAEDIVVRAAGSVGFEEDEQHQVGIAVRESMVNAVAHGNQYSSRKKVRLQVSRNALGIVVEIDDEGRGFDPSDVPDPRDGDNILRQSGRGLLMIRAFMDEFEIRRGDSHGTHVRMAKYLQAGQLTEKKEDNLE
ncbi:MAG: ATP-binding protein [Bryobacterales bacterium]|nr:ATP-binding protein [Bryobacterales bacterium]